MFFGKRISIQEICSLIGCVLSNDGMKEFTKDWVNSFNPENEDLSDYVHCSLIEKISEWPFNHLKSVDKSALCLKNALSEKISTEMRFFFDIDGNYYIGIPLLEGESLLIFTEKVKKIGNIGLYDFILNTKFR
jgi:hypothetical protein